MTNKDFFKACLVSELASTVSIIEALPNDKQNYRPHPNSRSAFEIAEHIIAHAFDFEVILKNSVAMEVLQRRLKNFNKGANLLAANWERP